LGIPHRSIPLHRTLIRQLVPFPPRRRTENTAFCPIACDGEGFPAFCPIACDGGRFSSVLPHRVRWDVRFPAARGGANLNGANLNGANPNGANPEHGTSKHAVGQTQRRTRVRLPAAGGTTYPVAICPVGVTPRHTDRSVAHRSCRCHCLPGFAARLPVSPVRATVPRSAGTGRDRNRPGIPP